MTRLVSSTQNAEIFPVVLLTAGVLENTTALANDEDAKCVETMEQPCTECTHEADGEEVHSEKLRHRGEVHNVTTPRGYTVTIYNHTCTQTQLSLAEIDDYDNDV
jgi:hypothetical protein